MTTPYQEGYEQGEWDTENRLHDDMDELRASVKALEHIAQATVAYFGDLRTTMAEVRDLTPRDVDELKRITHDSPVLVVSDWEIVRGDRGRS